MANDRFKLVVEWGLPNSSIAQNILYANIGGGDVADPQQLVADIGSEVIDIFQPWLIRIAANCVLSRVLVYAFDEVNNTAVPLGTDVINNPGTNSNNTLPCGNAVKVNLFPLDRSRPAGMYLPPTVVNSLEPSGSMSSSVAAAAINGGIAATQVRSTAVLGLQWIPMYYSVKDGGLVSLTNSSVQVDTTIDYMRSRKRGNGI